MQTTFREKYLMLFQILDTTIANMQRLNKTAAIKTPLYDFF